MWQPIETAPKDGTLIVGYGPVDMLERKRDHMAIVFWCIKDPWVSGWEVYGGSYLPPNMLTHWMPVPPSPESKD